MKIKSTTIDGVETEVIIDDSKPPKYADMLAVFKEKFGQGSNFSWLMRTPISDINAQNALKSASVDELKAVLAFLPQEGNKTKIKAIEAEIRRRNK